MKRKSLPVNAIITLLVAVIILSTGCKKEKSQKDADKQPVFTQMPDSVMFVNTMDSTGITINVINSSIGSAITKYHYADRLNLTWCYPAAGNGYLYCLQNTKINAININTGVIVWTDTINNARVPVLHNDIFYGVCKQTNGSYSVYALDATKHIKTFLWQYALSAAPVDVQYYYGAVYVLQNQNHLTVLDAAFGALRWDGNNGPYSLTALNSGVITSGNNTIYPVNGDLTGTATAPAIPPTYAQNTTQTELVYATQQQYFIQTDHFNSPPGLSTHYLSAVDKTTRAEKWRTNYGGGQVDYDTINYVKQLWNNQLIITKLINTGAGKYGVTTDESHWILDINTGLVKLKLADAGKGRTVDSYIAANTMVFYKHYESTLSGLPYGSVPPPANYFFTIDLSTGKQKWENDKITSAGYNGSCIFAGGKGFSPYIQ